MTDVLYEMAVALQSHNGIFVWLDKDWHTTTNMPAPFHGREDCIDIRHGDYGGFDVNYTCGQQGYFKFYTYEEMTTFVNSLLEDYNEC